MADLREDLERWVGDGLISRGQAEEILAHEARRPGGATSARVPLVLEAVGYLGGGLAAIAASIFMARIWDQLQPWAKLSFILLLAVTLRAAGGLIRTSSEPAVQRLASFLWMLSAGGIAFSTALLASEVIAFERAEVFLSASGVSAVYSFGLWMVRRRPLQQLTSLAALISTVVAVILLPERGPDVFFVGLAVWGTGVVWVILSWAGLVEPSRVGLIAGGVTLLVAAEAASADSYRVWGLWLGLASAVALLPAGVGLRSSGVIGLGAFGVIVFTPQLILHIFEDTLGAPLALLIAGLALVVGAVVSVRLRAREAS